jgi:hypothetical protein
MTALKQMKGEVLRIFSRGFGNLKPLVGPHPTLKTV